MMLNIVIVLVMFIPFYAALAHKHSGWLTYVITLLWCGACSTMMILVVALAFMQQVMYGTIPTVTMITIIAWGAVDMFIGLKMVLTDRPTVEK